MARLVLCLFLSLLLPVQAQDDNTPKRDEPGLTILEQLPTHNQIPLLNNRFRIDDGVKSITLVFFRRPGTASIVLVRPDGSKVFYNTAKQHNMRWHDAATYDLIEINEPMPGPWQAVGRILPESRILVLTDVELKVDPLPEALMVGETFKLTARLMDGESVVNARDFSEILTLQVLFISTNNREFDNFGRGLVEVATFRDDGRGFDATARDGIFTGEVNLNFGAGEWIPRFVVKTPLYTREVELAPVLIAAAPVSIEFVQAAQVNAPHHIVFTPVSEQVVASSLLFQGVVRYPDGEMSQFSLTEPAQKFKLELLNKGPGSYLVNVAAFGEMTDGREFVLNLPEERFLVMLQAHDAPALPDLPNAVPDAVATTEDVIVATPFPWGVVILSNLAILGIGGIAIWLVLTGRSFNSLIFWRKSVPQTKPVDPGNKAVKAKTQEKDDILDLSLPDD
ncbi:TIGR03503 family protein [Alishewanella jeotgali]|uniref:TIGR03503 family protein n=1 Tax=Alishewanella jeotgali KCTC 22429 TaxID=1129374 RepID=H3ZBQ9_9ALTE|nr:TIGR03503 family protein [Alishewanella jeotgali]EHR42373.1 hypothetical protein AJE_03821 [Alishewanella jeotgali KCTC 22429]